MDCLCFVYFSVVGVYCYLFICHIFLYNIFEIYSLMLDAIVSNVRYQRLSKVQCLFYNWIIFVESFDMSPLLCQYLATEFSIFDALRIFRPIIGFFLFALFCVNVFQLFYGKRCYLWYVIPFHFITIEFQLNQFPIWFRRLKKPCSVKRTHTYIFLFYLVIVFFLDSTLHWHNIRWIENGCLSFGLIKNYR